MNTTAHYSLSPSKSKSYSSLAALIDVKQRRKIVESNARLLANRLIALSLEEQRIKTHTKGIQKKACDLLVHRIDRNQKKKEKSILMLTKGYNEKSFDDMRNTVTQARTQQAFGIHKVKKEIFEERKKEAIDVKGQSLKNLEKIYQSRQKKIEQLKEICIKVKEEESQVPAKFKKAGEDRLAPVRQRREKLISEEIERIKFRMQEIKKLDKQEDLLLESLHKAEKEDSNAVSQYNDISSLPVQDLTQKYKCYMSAQKTNKFRSTGAFFPSKTDLTIMKSF